MYIAVAAEPTAWATSILPSGFSTLKTLIAAMPALPRRTLSNMRLSGVAELIAPTCGRARSPDRQPVAHPHACAREGKGACVPAMPEQLLGRVERRCAGPPERSGSARLADADIRRRLVEPLRRQPGFRTTQPQHADEPSETTRS